MALFLVICVFLVILKLTRYLGINYNLIAGKILESQVVSAMDINLLTFADMFGLIVFVYVLLGVGIGVLGSCISMRRYLKV